MHNRHACLLYSEIYVNEPIFKCHLGLLRGYRHFQLEIECQSQFKDQFFLIHSMFGLGLNYVNFLDTAEGFWYQDNHYLTSMEESKWFHLVSACLGLARKISNNIVDMNQTVVIHGKITFIPNNNHLKNTI